MSPAVLAQLTDSCQTLLWLVLVVLVFVPQTLALTFVETLAEGKRLFSEVQFQEARVLFQQVIDSQTATIDEKAEAYLWLGYAYYKLEPDGDYNSYLCESRKLRPSYVLSPNDFPPRIVTAYTDSCTGVLNARLCLSTKTWCAPTEGGSKTISVSNCGNGRQMNFTLTVDSADRDWLSVDQSGGAMGSSSKDVTLSAKVLRGSTTRDGRIVISALGVPGSPDTVLVSQITSAGIVGSYKTPGTAYGVAVSGSIAYVADGSSGLQIINISNPTTPTLVGSYNTPGEARGIAVADSYAYVADFNSGLQVIDISKPAAPKLTGSYNTPGIAYDVAVSDNYAYVADWESGLQIIDISKPAAPKRTGSYDTPGRAYGVAVSGNDACVADRSSGLQIIDISKPAAPKRTGSYDSPGQAYGVAVSGNDAYVADRSSGLQIIDISKPAAPKRTGSCNTPYAYDVVVFGNYAYVADHDSGLLIIDIRNPATPKLIGSYDTPGQAFGIAVSGSYAYVADGSSGLQIIRICAGQ